MIPQQPASDSELVYRTRPNDHFTIIGNDVLRDKRLTTDAAAILFRLASHKDGWRFTAASLAAEWPGLSVRSAERAIRLLRDCGYVHRVITRQGNRLATSLVMFTPPVADCGLRGCQDCSHTSGPQSCDPTKPQGHSDLGKQGVSAGRSDRAVSDGHKLSGLIEDHQVEDHVEDGLFSAGALNSASQATRGAAGATAPSQAQVITRAVYEATSGMIKFPAVLAIVKRALQAGEWDAEQVQAALMRVVEANRPITLETLRGQLVKDNAEAHPPERW